MLIKKIGRYTLPLGSVQAAQVRETKGWRRFLFWRKSGFDVILNNGQRVHFTAEEKAAYDLAMDWYLVTAEWYGAARGLGLRG